MSIYVFNSRSLLIQQFFLFNILVTDEDVSHIESYPVESIVTFFENYTR